MKFNDRSASRRTRTPLAQALACVLLIGVIYAVTFGSAHSHGNVSSGLETNRAAGKTQRAGFSSNVPFRSQTHEDECLTCLLHQQLFNSIVHATFFSIQPSVQDAFVLEPAFFYRSSPITSNPIARLSGRAPPLSRG